MGSPIQTFGTKDWIEIVKTEVPGNHKLKRIVFGVVFTMIVCTFCILMFVVVKVIKRKKRGDLESTFSASMAGLDDADVYKSFVSNEESVYSQISKKLEKAQKKRMETKTRDARR